MTAASHPSPAYRKGELKAYVKISSVANSGEHADDYKRKSAGYANIRHVENGKVDEAELYEIGDKSLREPIDCVPDAPSDDERERNRLQPAHLTRAHEEKQSDRKAHDHGEHAQHHRIVREDPPRATSIVHKPYVDQPEKRASKQTTGLLTGKHSFSSLVEHHPKACNQRECYRFHNRVWFLFFFHQSPPIRILANWPSGKSQMAIGHCQAHDLAMQPFLRLLETYLVEHVSATSANRWVIAVAAKLSIVPAARAFLA